MTAFDAWAGLALPVCCVLLLIVASLQAPGKRHARVTREGGTMFLSEAIMQDFVSEGEEVVVDVASKDEADEFDGDQVVVKIIKKSTGESMLVQVEDDAGLGSVEFQSPEDEALNRDMPPLPEEGAFE